MAWPVTPIPLNPVTIAQVLAVLPATGGLKPSQALAQLGGHSSPGSVRAILLHLVRTGEAVREGKSGQYLYRRAIPAPPIGGSSLPASSGESEPAVMQVRGGAGAGAMAPMEASS